MQTESSPTPAGGPPERRQRSRYEYRRPILVHVTIAPGLECGRALLADISAVSAGLLLARPLEPGVVLVFRPKGRAWGQAIHQEATVVHAAPRPGGTWHIGCTLNPPLAEADLARLVAADG